MRIFSVEGAAGSSFIGSRKPAHTTGYSEVCALCTPISFTVWRRRHVVRIGFVLTGMG